MTRLALVIVGACGNTHIASSLARAATALGLAADLRDTASAYAGNRWLRAAAWRLAGHRPLRIGGFSRETGRAVLAARPRALMVVGQSPLNAQTVASIRASGARCVNWSTDDPWSPAHRARWHLRALRCFDAIFTPRRSNMADFRRLGCNVVHWLPFGFDPNHFDPSRSTVAGPERHDVLFVGGADRDRAKFFEAFVRTAPAPMFVGAYWERHVQFRARALGLAPAETCAALTTAAAVNLCLVRRANRDGHVMRSFEIAAARGFMIAEDTTEHRELFGDEGECVLYFADAAEAAAKTRWALAHPDERRRMASAAARRVRDGANTYTDRLRQMLPALGICAA